MKSTFEYKGKKITYSSDWVGKSLWVHVNGKTFVVEAEQQTSRGRRKQETISHDKVMAPMPGKVTKILVVQDQTVSKGQPVLVMEAMKMEYTLKAELNGKVKKTHVEVGAQVTLGQVLVELEEKPK